jgi:transposase/5-methylcytosine-specific restriction endonuclease McrA
MITKDKLYDLYWKKGLSQRAIAEKLNTTKSAIRHRMKKYKINTRKHDKRPEDAKLKELFLNEGLNENKIAEIYNAHPRTVRGWLSDCGLTENNLVKVSKRKLVELYRDEGLTQKEIAKMLNCSEATVLRKMKKYNIKTRGGYRSHKEFVNIVNNKYDNEYTVLGKYKNNRIKVKIKHNSCGFIFKVRPEHFIKGIGGCPVCVPGVSRTTESFKKEVKLIHGNKYSVLGRYKNNKTKIKVKCNICGYVWSVLPDNFIYKESGCRKCYKKRIVGEGHPRWNPDLTEEDRNGERTRTKEYRNWIKKVFKRDNYTCQICGDRTSDNLSPHHLNGYDNFEDQRTDVDNGITLCKDCHKGFHQEYGYGNNTKEQFEQFIRKEMKSTA